jgi:hypothetical protein
MTSSIAIVTSANARHASSAEVTSAEVASAEAAHVTSAEAASAEATHVTSAETTAAAVSAATATASATTACLCTRRKQTRGKQSACQYHHRSSCSHDIFLSTAEPLVIIEGDHRTSRLGLIWSPGSESLTEVDHDPMTPHQ